jgi:hypothetical protein
MQLQLPKDKVLMKYALPLKSLAFVAALGFQIPSFSGSIFLTGHDPVWHSAWGPNPAGAVNFSRIMIEYARNGSTLPFLYVESKNVPIPGGNDREAPFLASHIGYAPGDYVVMDAADLGALPDFRAALNSYSAIVVASDHGGMLTFSELQFLNAHSADIIDYLNDGGGLAAAAESNDTSLIGSTPRFGFLPFVIGAVDDTVVEVGNTLTPFGESLGLLTSDINNNFSHNFFTAAGGMTQVDLLNGDPNRPLSLAFRGLIDVGGVQTPDAGATGLMLMLAGTGLCLFRRRD